MHGHSNSITAHTSFYVDASRHTHRDIRSGCCGFVPGYVIRLLVPRHNGSRSQDCVRLVACTVDMTAEGKSALRDEICRVRRWQIVWSSIFVFVLKSANELLRMTSQHGLNYSCPSHQGIVFATECVNSPSFLTFRNSHSHWRVLICVNVC